MIFGIKTRKDLKLDVASLEGSLYRANTRLMALTDTKERQAAKINFYEHLFNMNIFENVNVDLTDNSLLLELDDYKFTLLTDDVETTETNNDNNEVTDEVEDGAVVKYNATLYCDYQAPYMYLSKKLTEGYKYFAVNFVQGNLRFFLNNDGIGMEIDSNNRVRNKLILKFLGNYFDFVDGKISIFFKKIQNC